MENSAKSRERLIQEITEAHEQITRLKASEAELLEMRKQLRESEEKYRMAFEYTGTAMMVVEEDMTISLGNHKIEEITGYTHEEIMRKKKWTEYVIEEDHERMLDYHQKRRDQIPGIPSEYEFRLRHKSGDIRDIMINVSVIPGTSKTLISLIDITDRKRMEKALHESERQYRDLFQNANDIIYVHDFDGNFITANTAALTTYGYTDTELKQLSIKDIIHPEYLQIAVNQIQSKLSAKQKSVPYELRTFTKDRRSIWVEVSTRLICTDGRPVAIQGIARDITERKVAEKKLFESEQRFRRIFSHSPIGIALLDQQGHILDINHSFQTMFDLHDSDTVNLKNINLFDSIELPSTLRKKCNSGEGVQYDAAYDFNSFAWVDGNSPVSQKADRYLDWHFTTLSVTDGSPPLNLVQVQDITERKEAEAAKLRAVQQEAEKAHKMVEELRLEMRQTFSFHSMVSRSPQMRNVFDLLPEMAHATATVLISGESGTGKEMIANTLHELSPRKENPFVAINCSALPDTLLESELFGYKAGAFTDAKKDKPGKFTLAEGGSLFLDEIGDISPAMQVKLLRVLQEKTYEPLGAIHSQKADVRIIAATNRDLPSMVREGAFREDLYYRINVLRVTLPPLRERLSDIPLLCEHFISVFNTRYHKHIKRIASDALDVLLGYDFPGNIRELENIIEHAFVFCKGNEITLAHLPPSFSTDTAPRPPISSLAGIKSLDELERLYIQNILETTGGNKIKAAKKLGVHKATLFRKLKKLNIN
jgi:PAS domain S-box-containing protein